MKSMLWKVGVILLAMGAFLVIGAFAEGMLGVVNFAAMLFLLCRGVRWSWARACYWEHREARASAVRRMRANSRSKASSRPVRAA